MFVRCLEESSSGGFSKKILPKDAKSISPKGFLDNVNANYGRITHSRRDGSQRMTVKNSASGFRNSKNQNLKHASNFSVDVREYFNDEAKATEGFKIPITQSHGHNSRGLSSDQMQDDNPEDLNLLFYNFNRKGKKCFTFI